MADKGQKKSELTYKDRKACFGMLLITCRVGRPSHGSFVSVAKQFGAHPRTVRRLWERVISNMETHLEKEEDYEGIILLDQKTLPLTVFPDEVFLSKRSNSGRKKKYDREKLGQLTKVLPLSERGTYSNLAANLNVAKTTAWRLQNDGFTAISSALKPSLTEEQKITRVQYCLSFIDKRSYGLRNEHEYQFTDMMADVHVDEKWFFLTRDHRRYILAPGEKPPKRETRHKSHIEKVMFFCAQARPPYDPATRRIWDGKIGMFPIGDVVRQQRKSKLRNKGDPKWKNKNVSSQVYLELMMDVVIAIATKWPRGQWNDPNFKVRLQQDGARAHTSKTFYADWYCMMEGLVYEGILPHRNKIFLDTQPAQSPDLNINDLGLFAALQAMYNRTVSKDALELVENVKKTYAAYPHRKINFLFLTLQSVMNEIVENHGGNHYDIPHMSKEKLERAGELPVVLEVTALAAGLLDTTTDFDNNPTVHLDTEEISKEEVQDVEQLLQQPMPECLTRYEFSRLHRHQNSE